MTAKNTIYYTCKRLLWLASVISVGCKEHYRPPVITTNRNYLVVDGVIVSGNDSTIIKLSRTIRISDTILPAPETGATVIVKGESGDQYPLTEEGGGRYVSAGLKLNVNQQYQLTINTTDGKLYESDFVEVKQSPPIDSVYWYQDKNNNVEVGVSTHDPLNQAKYYRWEYAETWIYHTKYYSTVDWVDSQVVLRPPNEQVYYCWSSEKSGNVNIYSTAKLADDVASNIHVAEVPNSSEKIGYTFSILVNQYALTKDAYDFWDELKQNTEQLGTLFDPQPGQVPTNIQCVNDPGQVVIGYVSVSSLQQQRIFINRAQLKYWDFVPYFDYYTDYCVRRIVPEDSMNYFFPANKPSRYVIVGEDHVQPTTYELMFYACADCRDHGGTNIKPPFWP
ncbi:MAG TPA: DUF4249 domain-containing protein [Chitinophagaceae bacterium]|nr:DUF4249 domain-containing protein [Chitinophagaceae bacterium]